MSEVYTFACEYGKIEFANEDVAVAWADCVIHTPEVLGEVTPWHELMADAILTVHSREPQKQCPECEGDGLGAQETGTCLVCHGRGTVVQDKVTCYRCKGAGEFYADYPDPQTIEMCGRCDGMGFMYEDLNDDYDAAEEDAAVERHFSALEGRNIADLDRYDL